MLMTGGQEASNMLFGEQPAQIGRAQPSICRQTSTTTRNPADFDWETGEVRDGVIDVEAKEEPAEPKTFGPAPETDLEIPRGPHKGKMLSELVRTDRKYVEDIILKSSNPSWGMCAEAWIKHVYGEGGDDGVAW